MRFVGPGHIPHDLHVEVGIDQRLAHLLGWQTRAEDEKPRARTRWPIDVPDVRAVNDDARHAPGRSPPQRLAVASLGKQVKE